MALDPLQVHNHFRCNRKDFEGLEYYYKPVEVKINPKIDWDEFADVEEFEKLITPRLDRGRELASSWEWYLLNECIRLGCWRIWFVQWCEYTETAAFMNTRVWPAWGFKEAQAFAKSLGEHITGISLKRWLLMGNEQFLRESGSSQNRDVVMKMRRVLGARCRRKVRK